MVSTDKQLNLPHGLQSPQTSSCTTIPPRLCGTQPIVITTKSMMYLLITTQSVMHLLIHTQTLIPTLSMMYLICLHMLSYTYCPLDCAPHYGQPPNLLSHSLNCPPMLLTTTHCAVRQCCAGLPHLQLLPQPPRPSSSINCVSTLCHSESNHPHPVRDLPPQLRPELGVHHHHPVCVPRLLSC